MARVLKNKLDEIEYTYNDDKSYVWLYDINEVKINEWSKVTISFRYADIVRMIKQTIYRISDKIPIESDLQFLIALEALHRLAIERIPAMQKIIANWNYSQFDLYKIIDDYTAFEDYKHHKNHLFKTGDDLM